MFTADNLSLVANICTIVSSFSIVYAVYFYIKGKIQESRSLNFSNIKKRSKFFKMVAIDLSLVSKVEIKSKAIKNRDLTYILSNRNYLTEKNNRENYLKNALRFIFSDEAIQLLTISFPYVAKNLNHVLNRYCQLALDGVDFYSMDSKTVDAWVQLPQLGQFIIKFPIPNELYNEERFNNSRWSGDGSITGLGEKVVTDYFFPYLINYVSRQHENLTEADMAIILSPYSWEFGPS
ncbi:hypothetical protein [Photobacterium damselae]|uniref:hypothetical protein n=1 Tax=Photobacterium damselae TaxID=38293 RepID=UPI000D664645|nr:hypothetical protein [Photobacterium damselae]AWK84719.1 hypothetical protein BST98_22105 [Photobacterium damselae]MBE8127723.1 hypothetical protein [Photobacterium damselae subsp. piscicida]MCG3826269.1 hypothetical protein [Photobacterium damselae]WIH21988.1 hypothetical protein KQY33_20130 [Photobacterium damselae]